MQERKVAEASEKERSEEIIIKPDKTYENTNK